MLAVLAESGGSCDSIGECRASIRTLWGLDFDELELAQALTGLLKDGLVGRSKDDGAVRLAPAEKARLEAHARVSRADADLALEEWREVLTDRWPGLTSSDLEALERELNALLTRVVHRHGAEAALLLYPDEEAARQLYRELEEEGFGFVEATDTTRRQRREWALFQFLRRPTEAQRRFLSTVLNSAYVSTVLTIDPAGARLIQDLAAGQRVYLDTNFIYRLLGVQGPRYVKPAETILRVTQAAGYVCAVTPWTISEFRRSLDRSRRFLEMYPLPPDDFAALAADSTSDEDFATSYWRQVKDQRLSVGDYVAFYSEVETHLTARGIGTNTDGITAVEQRTDIISAEISVLERVLHGKQRHPDLLEHDVKHRLLVERLRGSGNRTFANAGYWFLTHDTVLPRYDYQTTGRDSNLPFCVSASAWFQVVEAFRPKTEDLEQTLADILASPYIRPRREISKKVAQAVVARVALYRDGTPELAARVFMNSAAMTEVEGSPSQEKQTEKIDKAIVSAAKEAQQDARAAHSAAAEERSRAQREAVEAAAALQAVERRNEEDAERIKAQHDEALRNEEARGREAALSEKERGQAALREEQRAHQAALEQTKTELAAQRHEAAKYKRRVRLATTFVVLLVVFLAVGLVGGLDSAWQFIVGIGVLAGLAAAADQLLGKMSAREARRTEPTAAKEPDR